MSYTYSPTDSKSGGITAELAQWIAGVTPPTLPTDYVDIGNVISWGETPKVTKKPHVSHRQGKAVTDAKVEVKDECTLKLTTDTGTLENIRKFFSGSYLDGETIYPFGSPGEIYSVKITEHLVSGTELIHVWHKVELSPGAEVQLVNHGEGEGDWFKLEFSGEVMDDTEHNPTNPWGSKYVAPTA